MYPEEEQRPHLRLETTQTRDAGPRYRTKAPNWAARRVERASGYAPDSTRFFSPPSARATIIFTAWRRMNDGTGKPGSISKL